MTQREELEQAIESLEARRGELEDEVVEASLAALREKLARLQAQEHEAVTSPSFERRTVTVLFCDVRGSTAMAERLDPEEWTDIMNLAFERLAQPVRRFGGKVARVMGDAILAFFGAPKAHEDDPRRAVLAGLAILEQIQPFREELQEERGLNFNVRVGINTGLAVVGDVGSEEATEYTAMGDAVNVGARMEQTAEPGTVQITEQTFRLVAPHFECQPLGRIEVKGKDEPVQAYRVLGRKAGPEGVRGLVAHDISSPLVGREAELAQARSAVRRLLAGQGGILSIIGGAGIGKSRLLAELRKDVLAENLTWLEGNTLSYGQTISYWPFQEILGDYAGINEEDSEATAWDKLESHTRSLFPETIEEILPYLASLLALEVKGEYAERVKYLDGQAMGQQVILATRRFFERLASAGPLVLAFEDLHWMDASSARLVERLLPLVEQVPLLLCGLSRPDPDTPATHLREIAKEDFSRRHTEIVLSPLSPEDSSRLVQNLLAIEGLPVPVRELILDRADGNPFFLEEIIRDLIEGGSVIQDPASDRWKVTAQVEEIAIPDTIQGVIIARIDRLDEAVRRVLRKAAVIGRSFRYRVLRNVADSEPDLDERLAELQATELIREKQRHPELEYMFKHALAREAVYENTLLKKRRELHTRVGEVIETLFADRLEEFYGLLAYHYAQAEAWELAQGYLIKAGDQAGRLAADAEALANYRRALTAYGDRLEPLQRGSLAWKMGEACRGLGKSQESRRYFLQALKALGQPMPTTRPGLVAAVLGQILLQALHRLWPSRFVGTAPEAKRAGLREAVLAYERLGYVFYVEGESVPLFYTTLRLLNLAERAGSPAELARAYATSGVGAALIPLHSLAEYYGQLALENTQLTEDPFALAAVLQMSGIYNTGIGRWKRAIDDLSRATEILQRIGRLHSWEECRATMALACHWSGQYSRSRSLSSEVYDSAEKRGDPQAQIWGLANQAVTLLRLGRPKDLDRALENMLQAKALLAEYQLSVRPDEIFVHGVLAQVYRRKREAEPARQAAEIALRHVNAELMPVNYYPFEGYAGAPDVYLWLWEASMDGEHSSRNHDSLRKMARQSCKGLNGYARVYSIARPRSQLYQGLYRWLDGKPGKAHKAWRQGIARAEELDMPYDQGVIHYEIGRHLEPGDVNRDEHLRRAIDLFSRLDAAWDLARAEEVLAGP